MSRSSGVSRQTLYPWRAKGQRALESACAPKPPQAAVTPSGELQRAVLTLLIQGYSSYLGIQACLKELMVRVVSLGTISAIAKTTCEHSQSCLWQLYA